MSEPSVSVIIRCRNEERHIGRLLEGISRQESQPKEILIVDSGSTDATLAIARRYPVRIMRIEPSSFSFGYALNRGCEEATGEALVFVSAHVYPVYRTWLSELIKPFADEKVALVYGRQRGDERTKLSERSIFAKWFPEVSSASQKHAFCNNANAAVRREVWLEHRYDETLTGLEDLDWAKRVMARGYRIAYSAEAEIVHVHEESYRQVRNRYYREAMAMHQIFPEEKFTASDFARALAGNIAGDWRMAARTGELRKAWWSVPAFRLMQFSGTFKGYRARSGMLHELRDRFYYPDGRPAKTASDSDGRESLKIDYRSQGGGA